MTRFIAVALMTVALLLAAPASAEITGTITGTPFACFADDLNSETKATLNRWIELNRKKDAGTLSEEEYLEGGQLAFDPLFNPAGKCGALPEGLPVTVRLLDGLDYFVAVANDDGTFTTFVLKADGFDRDEE